MDLAGLVIGSIALLVSGFVGWRQLKLQKAANEVNDAVRTLEQQRRHDEMTPQFDFSYEHQGADAVRLRIELAGPVGLSSLDGVAVSIRDDVADRAPRIAGGPSAEEIRRHIWGPYRLRPGVYEADSSGRTAPAAPLRRGEALYFMLEPSPPPQWNPDRVSWRRTYDGMPLRLTLVCTQEADTWEVPREVMIEAQSRPNIRWLS